MQTSYTRDFLPGLVGDLATLRPYRCIARVYPKRRQITTIAVGGATDGTYTVRITSPAGTRPGATAVDSSFAATGSSADLIGAALATAINAQIELRNLLRASYNATNDTLVLTAVRTGESFTVAFPSNPGTHLTQTATQSPVVSTLPLGVGMVSTDGAIASRPSAVTDLLAGVVKRGRGIEGRDDNSAEFHQAGDTLELLTEGDVFVESEQDVTNENAPVYMRVVATGDEVLGAFRASPDGAAQTNTVTPVADQAQYAFELGFRGQHYTAMYQPTDGTTTVADAIDGLFDAIGTIPGLTITDTGTTLQIVTAAGESLDYLRNTAWNADAEAASTVVVIGTAGVDCVLIPRSRAKWLKPASGTTSAARAAALQLFGG